MAKILAVDDEPAILQMMKLNLEMAGHEVHLAGDGSTALNRIQRDRPDLVLLDVMMPSLDGWEVLERLAAMDLPRRVKVVLVTAKTGDATFSRAFELGADDYLSKPFELDNLLDLVEEVLRRTEGESLARRRQLKEELAR